MDGKLAIGKSSEKVNRVENNIFANSFIDTTIQNSGKRERSIWCHTYNSNLKFSNKKINIKEKKMC